MNKEKLKAYCSEIDWGDSVIVWTKTAGQAKRQLADEYGERFIDIRVYRVPWADGYKDMADIPPQVYFDHAWGIVCAKCHKLINEDDKFFDAGNAIYYCEECMEDMK